MACPSPTIQQLCDLTHKAYIKQKMASKKGLKRSTVSIITPSAKTQALYWKTSSGMTTPVSSIKRAENMTPMPMMATIPSSGESHGTSDTSQETEKTETNENLTGDPKATNQCIQKQLVWIINDKTHLGITQSSMALSTPKNETVYPRKIWNN